MYQKFTIVFPSSDDSVVIVNGVISKGSGICSSGCWVSSLFASLCSALGRGELSSVV
jgi:hypothetical protein